MRSGTHNYRWLRCAKLEQQFYLRLISEAIGLRVRGDDIEKPGYGLCYLKIEQRIGSRRSLPPLQHDLAARLAGFQQRMRALQISRVDAAKGLVERCAQYALVDEVGDVVQQIVLRDHVRRLERRAGEHRFPVDGNRLAFENADVEFRGIVD